MNKQEKSESKRLPGFYIALCCCVIAVGVAGYFTERATKNDAASEISDNGGAPEQDGLIAELPGGEAAQGDAVAANGGAGNVTADKESEIYIEPQSEAPDNSAADNAADNSGAQDAEAADSPQVIYEDMSEDAEAAEAAAIFSSPSFSLPASGEVLSGFSDTLAYSGAMGDWRTHNGADIAVDAGGSVCAAADGTVSKISADAMGDYVVIDHSGGFSTKYCSLSSVEDISEGDAVKAGDVIGVVADSRAEDVTQTHVHFEMYKDGKPVNPMDYVQ